MAVDKAQMDDIKAKFKAMDRDGNGLIDSKEAHKVLSSSLGFSAEKTKIIMRAFDKNKDGKLNYDEFVPFYFAIRGQQAQMKEMFRQFDKDKNGYITFEEAKAVLGSMFNDKEIINLIKIHDINNDGKLQFDEFVEFWSNV